MIPAEADGRSRPDFSGEVVAAVDPFETDTPVLRAAAAQAAIYGVPLRLVGVTATHILSPEWMPSEEHLIRMYDEAAQAFTASADSLKGDFPISRSGSRSSMLLPPRCSCRPPTPPTSW